MNQIDNIKSFTSDMRFDVVGLTRRVKSVIAAATKPFLRSKCNELPTFFALAQLQTNPRLSNLAFAEGGRVLASSFR